MITIISIMSEYTKKEYLAALLFYLSLLSIFLIGCRDGIGADWQTYKFFFENGYSNVTYDGNFEIGYAIWNKILGALGLSSGMFFAITAFLSLFILFRSARQFGIRNIAIPFLFYYCLFLASLQFNIIRTGILGSCLMYSLALKPTNKKESIIWLFIGVSIHYMGIIFVPLWFFIERRVNVKLMLSLMLIAILIYSVGIVSFINKYMNFLFLIDQRASDYVNYYDRAYGLSVGMCFNIVLFFVLFITQKRKYEKNIEFRILLNTLFISILISISMFELGIFVERICQILNISLVFIWPMLIRKILERNNRISSLILSIFLCYYLSSYFLKSIGYGDYQSPTSAYPYKYNINHLI